PHVKFAAAQAAPPASNRVPVVAPAPQPVVADPPAKSTGWRMDTAHAPTTKSPFSSVTAPASAPLSPPTAGMTKAVPLSSYAPPAPAVESFRPAFEVDRFVWPALGEQLLRANPDGFAQLAQNLLSVARQRACKVIAITGCRRGEGRSQLMLALAKQLAA